MFTRQIAAAVILSCAIVGDASAQETAEKGIAKCAVLSGTVDRLQCFDDLAKALNLDGPQPVPVDVNFVGTGKWQVMREKNPIDDSETVTLGLVADTGQSTWNRPIYFFARCMSKKTEAYISWDDYLGNDGSFDNEFKSVTVRIGESSAKEQRWSLSTDSKATFAPGWAGELLKAMTKANKLVVQTTPYNENPVTAVFDTTGLANALKPLLEVCEWSL